MRSVPTGLFRLPLSSQDDNILSSWRWSVKTITALAAKKLGKFLAKDFRRVFGPAQDDMAERLGSFARSTIECLARSDALYHNFEHTLQACSCSLPRNSSSTELTLTPASRRSIARLRVATHQPSGMPPTSVSYKSHPT